MPLTLLVKSNTTADLAEVLSISDISTKIEQMPEHDQSISSIEDVPTAFLFMNHGHAKAGADAGCTFCSQLVRCNECLRLRVDATNLTAWMKHGFVGKDGILSGVEKFSTKNENSARLHQYIMKITLMSSLFVKYQFNKDAFILSLLMSLECFECYTTSVTFDDLSLII